METKPVKFVGGSKDGATVMVRDGANSFCIVRPGTFTIDEDVYTRRTLYFTYGPTIELFALKTLSDYDVITRLLERYPRGS